MSRCAFVEAPEGLEPESREWEELARHVAAVKPDILVMNEMPFGSWLAGHASYDPSLAERSIALHDAGAAALASLDVPAIISSRPVAYEGRLVNEAFAIENGQLRALHRKQYFPEELGWHEAAWFHRDGSGFDLHEICGLKIGVLLCTELMFNEHARRYGRAGADLIVVPRATGQALETWSTAAAMAAIVSGSYVVSSNRAGGSSSGPTFGGSGFAYGPRGNRIAQTSRAAPVLAIDIDVDEVRLQQLEYPCYVAE